MPTLPLQNGYNLGNLAYDFTLKDLDGRSHSLKELRGKSVVQVVFWATWCMPCIEEIPRLRELYRKYHDRGLEVLGVAPDLNQSPDGVRAFARDIEVNYPILWDDRHLTMSRYGVSSLPRNFLIDKDGVIRHAGTSLPGGHEALIERLLGDGGSPTAAMH
jgi:peroxiredoxin